MHEVYSCAQEDIWPIYLSLPDHCITYLHIKFTNIHVGLKPPYLHSAMSLTEIPSTPPHVYDANIVHRRKRERRVFILDHDILIIHANFHMKGRRGHGLQPCIDLLCHSIIEHKEYKVTTRIVFRSYLWTRQYIKSSPWTQSATLPFIPRIFVYYMENKTTVYVRLIFTFISYSNSYVVDFFCPRNNRYCKKGSGLQ